MKGVCPSDTRYTPLTQQRYCCVPTCMQIVMLKRRIPLVSQELIGHSLGLIVPQEDLRYFWNARTGKRPRSGYGTQVHKKEYDPNRAFAKLKIPLRISYRLIDEFPDTESVVAYLKSAEKADKDVLVCFDADTINNTNYHNGHVCVFDRIFVERNSVRLIDPSPKAPKWRSIRIKKLFEAMKKHGKYRYGGFWELSRR